MRILAISGDAIAQFELGLAYEYGRGLEQNCSDWYNYSEAAKWYRRSAEQGFADAQNRLGRLYHDGKGVSQNYSEAYTWYSKAAEQGHSKAISNLAYLYDLGLGVTRDEEKAMVLYEKAAERGVPYAMFILAISYRDGLNVKRDYVQAHKWFVLSRFYAGNSNNIKLKWRAQSALDKLEEKMTEGQLEKGRWAAREWYDKHQPRFETELGR